MGHLLSSTSLARLLATVHWSITLKFMPGLYLSGVQRGTLCEHKAKSCS